MKKPEKTSLMDFIGQAEKAEKANNKDKYLIMDLSQFIYMAKFVVDKNVGKDRPIEEYIDFYKHLIINNLISMVRYHWPVKRVILAADKSSWRKGLYGGIYKAGRKEKRNKDDFDWKDFFTRIESFKTELRDVFPFIVCEAWNAEGDDCLSILSRKLVADGHEPIIISSDKDMVQLLDIEGIKIWDPRKKQFKKALCPKNDLLKQILIGDKSDGIPNINYPIDHFVNKANKTKYGKVMGKKTADRHIANNTVFTELLSNDDLKRRFDENRQLIDLTMVPDEIHQKVLQVYAEQDAALKNKSAMKLMNYFSENRFRNLLDTLGDFEKLFQQI